MRKPYCLDASAMLAMIYAEPGGEIVAKMLNDGSPVVVSAVNLCETATKLAGRGWTATEVGAGLAPFVERCVDFGSSQALLAAEIVRISASLGLSLGDRACLSLAIVRDATALTADRLWKKLTLNVGVELIR